MDVEFCSDFDSLLQSVRKFSAHGFSWYFLFISSQIHLFSSQIRKQNFLSAGSTILAQELVIRLCSFYQISGFLRGTTLISESVKGHQGTTGVALPPNRHSDFELLNFFSLKS